MKAVIKFIVDTDDENNLSKTADQVMALIRLSDFMNCQIANEIIDMTWDEEQLELMIENAQQQILRVQQLDKVPTDK